MDITTGWYRTKNGDRAFVAAITPEGAPLLMEDDYAIGWIVTRDGWCTCHWTCDGFSFGADGEGDGDSLYSTELLASAPPQETN